MAKQPPPTDLPDRKRAEAQESARPGTSYTIITNAPSRFDRLVCAIVTGAATSGRINNNSDFAMDVCELARALDYQMSRYEL